MCNSFHVIKTILPSGSNGKHLFCALITPYSNRIVIPLSAHPSVCHFKHEQNVWKSHGCSEANDLKSDCTCYFPTRGILSEQCLYHSIAKNRHFHKLPYR
jgi:hypothetical protein